MNQSLLLMLIRSENTNDLAAIRTVNEAAFNRVREANLVDQLRADGAAVFSLVAVAAGQIVGHVVFSRMIASFRALGLGPIAVTPSHQRTGIGSRLIEKGLVLAESDGWEGVFVLGAPDYYRRFGFSIQAAAGFTSPYSGPHFMVKFLPSGFPQPTDGRVDYPPAFAALGC
jgi:putative acetyltransferase